MITPAYTPQCNPVERTNRTIKTMISQYVDKDQRTWDERLPALQFAYNTAWHETTGYTLAYLNCGRELVSPVSERTEEAQDTTTPEGINKQLQEAFEVVKINLAKAFQKQKRYYDLRRRASKPKLGDWVWRREHVLSKKAEAFNAKLAPKYGGPYEVRRVISPVIVDLRSKTGKWLRHVHIQDLKPVNKNKEKDDIEGEYDSDNEQNEGAMMTC